MSDDRVAKLEARVAELEKVISAMRAVFVGGPTAAEGASERDLDGQYGDPEVRMIPHDWTGTGVSKGMRLSRCPADFLDLYAGTMDYFAKKNDEKGEKDNKGNPKSRWDRKAAGLARGWARRIRAGWAPPPPAPAPTFGGGGIGFGAARFGGQPPGDDPFGAPARDHRRPFGAPAAPAAAPRPPPPPSAPSATEEDDGTDFNFGANVRPAAAPAASATLDDDDWPEEAGEAAQ